MMCKEKMCQQHFSEWYLLSSTWLCILLPTLIPMRHNPSLHPSSGFTPWGGSSAIASIVLFLGLLLSEESLGCSVQITEAFNLCSNALGRWRNALNKVPVELFGPTQIMLFFLYLQRLTLLIRVSASEMWSSKLNQAYWGMHKLSG